MEPQKYKVLNGEELTKIIKNQLPTDANKMKNLSSDDIAEIKQVLNNPATAKELKNKMFLVADYRGKTVVHELSLQEATQLNLMEGVRRDQCAADILRNATATDPRIRQIVDDLNSDYGQDIIAAAENGKQLQVSNIHVHDQAKLFDGMTSRFADGANIGSQRAEMQGKYLMTAIVDGKNVQKHISKEQFDDYTALPANKKLEKFNEIFGIKNGNSVLIADKQTKYSNEGIAIDNRAVSDVRAVLSNRDWYNRMRANGTEPTISNARISKEADGTAYLTANINGEQTKTRISSEEYNKLSQDVAQQTQQARQTQQTQQRNFFASSPLEILLQFLVAMMGIDVFGMNTAHQQQSQPTRQVQQPQQQTAKKETEQQGESISIPIPRQRAQDIASAAFEANMQENQEQTIHRGRGL